MFFGLRHFAAENDYLNALDLMREGSQWDELGNHGWPVHMDKVVEKKPHSRILKEVRSSRRRNRHHRRRQENWIHRVVRHLPKEFHLYLHLPNLFLVGTTFFFDGSKFTSRNLKKNDDCQANSDQQTWQSKHLTLSPEWLEEPLMWESETVGDGWSWEIWISFSSMVIFKATSLCRVRLWFRSEGDTALTSSPSTSISASYSLLQVWRSVLTITDRGLTSVLSTSNLMSSSVVWTSRSS